MKAWLVKRILVSVVISVTAPAGAKESLDLSKALSGSTLEKQNAEEANKIKVREVIRQPASEEPTQQKIVIDLRGEDT